MNSDQRYSESHPEAPAAFDRRGGCVCLNCGVRVPVTGYYADGEEVLAHEIDRHPVLRLVYGPLPSGRWGTVRIARQTRH